MNYIIVSLLLVSCMSSPNYLLYFVRFCGGSTPKIANSQTYHKELSYLFNYAGTNPFTSLTMLERTEFQLNFIRPFWNTINKLFLIHFVSTINVSNMLRLYLYHYKED